MQRYIGDLNALLPKGVIQFLRNWRSHNAPVAMDYKLKKKIWHLSLKSARSTQFHDFPRFFLFFIFPLFIFLILEYTNKSLKQTWVVNLCQGLNASQNNQQKHSWTHASGLQFMSLIRGRPKTITKTLLSISQQWGRLSNLSIFEW